MKINNHALTIVQYGLRCNPYRLPASRQSRSIFTVFRRKKVNITSLFQNSVSFGRGFRKTVHKDSFSVKSKVDFPKTEVLENPQLTNQTVTI